MVSSRSLTAVAGLVASLLISVVLWWYTGALFLFLFVPFVPFLFRGFAGGGQSSEREPPEQLRCPECGFSTRNQEYEYCPRDGQPLEEDGRWE